MGDALPQTVVVAEKFHESPRGFVEARLLETSPGRDGCFRVVLGRDLGPVVGLVLGGRDEADLAMKAPVMNQSTYSATAISTLLTDFQPHAPGASAPTASQIAQDATTAVVVGSKDRD